MRTRRRRPTPPADANELLAVLRGGRLLPPKQIRRLAIQWSESRADEPDDPAAGTRLRARELTAAGLLTAWQVEQLLAGHGRRLRLGHYVLTEWLGAGGMGSVYKAEHRLMKRVVALKVLGDAPRPESAVDLCPQSPPTAVLRSRREVEAAALLSHPNIVAAYDAVRARGVFFLVMEYVEGVDLGRLVAGAGPLPVRLACEAVRQAALALHYAHERGLLHGDVKPSNLLLVHPPRPRWDSDALVELTEGRRPTRVKLLDMGLARRLGGPDGTAGDDLEGTPDYMAPERGGGDPTDGRSDLYALGCTFYHLLTGQPPFPGGDCAAKLLRHRIDAPTPVRALRPDLPASVAVVVERLMARDVSDRPATAADAAADLEACMAPPPRVVTESHRGPAPTTQSRPRRLGSAVAVAAVLAGVLIAGAARWAQPRQSEAATVAVAVSSPLALPFIIEGRPGGFGSLAEAVAVADDGAVIILHGGGPYRISPLTWRGRSLTLRAAPGVRPVLQAAAPAADPWESLLTTDRALTLEGLELRSAPGAGGRLICCERAALRLTDCRLTAPDGAGIVHRNGGELSLRGCRVETYGAAVSVEVGDQKTCKVRITDTLLEVREPGGAAVALWASAVHMPTAVDLELSGDTIRAARASALTGLPAGLHVTARGNDFYYRDSLLSCAGYSDPRAWKRDAIWEGRDNRYHGPGAWLTIDGTAADIRTLGAWRGLWGGAEPGSREEGGK